VPPRVLIAEESLAYRRVMREALLAFRHCDVDDAATGEHAFELALKRPYALLLTALTLPDMKGDLLDRLTAKAYPRVHHGTHAAPPVIYLLKTEEQHDWQRLMRDARVRGHVLLPPRLDMLMTATLGLLEART
jgi:CheY-like chemotaxis protein